MNHAAFVLCVSFSLFVATHAVAAANEVLNFKDDIFAVPFAATREVASENTVPLQGFASWTSRDHPVAGDSVTILVTGTGMAERKQWLIVLSAEDSSLAAPESSPAKDIILFTNTGSEIHYTNTPVPLLMRIWGPFFQAATEDETSRQHPRATEAHDTVNESMLRLGFTRACIAMMQLHQARKEGRLAPDAMFGVGIKPFSRRELEEGSHLAAATGFVREDERAIAGTVPALMEYFDIAARSPGIRDLIWELVEKPSVWSVVRRMGRVECGVTFLSKGVAAVAASPWGLPATVDVFKIPFTLKLNGETGLHCILVVTQPRPPLLISAGILGLSVQSPNDDANRLLLRVIAARTAEKRST